MRPLTLIESMFKPPRTNLLQPMIPLVRTLTKQTLTASMQEAEAAS